MVIGNSHGKEILLGINPSHGDIQSLVLSSGYNERGGKSNDCDIEVVQQCGKKSKSESVFD